MEIKPIDSVPPPPPPATPRNEVEGGQERKIPETEQAPQPEQTPQPEDPDRVIDVFA